MDRGKLNIYKHISLLFFGISGLMVIVIMIVTFIHQDITSASPLIFWTVEYHDGITIVLMIFAVALGYGISAMNYKELRKNKEDSRSLMDLLFLFLNNEEKSILDFLVKNQGSAHQADIARLDGMNRVKAFRTLQRLHQRDLIEISAQGKIRKISLKSNLLQMLQEN